ncbi:hypothetical protein B0H17DRAFT_1140060 [Mycena rosella]|uniref:Uncharacterized protein n=1 Tax=Mycena rosella TaxID=1033263 RepID=A0AAD7D3B4_MYCRO|nr:hypothetical protein B0H17DRAFT_1140060 [Mycena rosella]
MSSAESPRNRHGVAPLAANQTTAAATNLAPSVSPTLTADSVTLGRSNHPVTVPPAQGTSTAAYSATPDLAVAAQGPSADPQHSCYSGDSAPERTQLGYTRPSRQTPFDGTAGRAPISWDRVQKSQIAHLLEYESVNRAAQNVDRNNPGGA